MTPRSVVFSNRRERRLKIQASSFRYHYRDYRSLAGDCIILEVENMIIRTDIIFSSGRLTLPCRDYIGTDAKLFTLGEARRASVKAPQNAKANPLRELRLPASTLAAYARSRI